MSDKMIPVGVVIERRDSTNKWVDNTWAVAGILPGAPPVEEWKKLNEGEGWEHYHAATLPLELYKGETEGYRYNLSQNPPRVYVILRQGEEAGEHDVEAFLVTACPYEAMSYAESGDEIVEGIPMPEPMISWAQEFVNAHHVDEPFKKRKNKKHKTDEARHGPRPGLER